MLKEAFKRLAPRSVYFDATATVILKVYVVSIGAAIDHAARPCIPEAWTGNALLLDK
jgi:hypothetical protein